MNRTHWVPGCSLLGQVLPGNRPFIASNSDNPWDIRTHVICDTGPRGIKYVGTELVCAAEAVPWANMITRAMNDRGFGFTFAYVEPNNGNYKTGTGFTFREWAQRLARDTESVDEALELLKSNQRAFHGNWLLADKTGRMIKVEINTRDFVVMTEPGMAITNHYVSDELAPTGDDDATPGLATSSRSRLAHASAMVASLDGSDPVGESARTLRSHAGRLTPEGIVGHSVCNHGTVFGTISSEIIDLCNGVFWYCYGAPCGEITPEMRAHGAPEMPWGHYLPFQVANLQPGEYTTRDGHLTPLGERYLQQALAR